VLQVVPLLDLHPDTISVGKALDLSLGQHGDQISNPLPAVTKELVRLDDDEMETEAPIGNPALFLCRRHKGG
jgi:hypothetical protein